MYNYYLAYDDGNILIRACIGRPIQKFDKSARNWVTDWDLAAIYFGGIPVKTLTEEEAKVWMV